jgi:hypothetical protein
MTVDFVSRSAEAPRDLFRATTPMGDSLMLARRRLAPVIVAFCVCASSGVRAEDLTRLLFLATDTHLSVPTHTAHFTLDNPENLLLVNGLNQAIASQLATVPIGSSAGGFTSTVDPTTGVGTRNSTTFGPQFAERALTIGKHRWDVGVQYLHSSFDQLNGTDITDGSLTIQLLHELEDSDNDGSLDDEDRFDPYYQGDVISSQLRYDLSIDTALVQGTFGLTDHLDLGLILPFVTADVTIDNFQTIQYLSTAGVTPRLHEFAGGATTNSVTYAGRASGIGDVVLRGKYNFLDPKQGSGIALALDVRLPTGDEKNFLGTGVTQAKIYGIGSWALGKFAPHANIGYTLSTGSSDVGDFPDEIDYTAGFEAECHPRVTFAFDIIGRYLLDANIPQMAPTPFAARQGETGPIQTTTLPQLVNTQDDLNLLDGAVGVKINPGGKWLISIGALVPLDDNGLTSDLSGIVGFSYSF